MNLKSIKPLYKLWLTFIISLLSITAFSQDHVTMTLKNVSATATTVDFDMYIVNDGTTALKLSACSFGVNYSPSILNGGTPGNPAFTFIAGTRDAGLTGLNTYTVVHTLVRNHLRTTMSPQAEASAPTLVPNVEYRIGTFRFTNTVAWTTDGNPAFALQLAAATGYTQCVGTVYSNGNTITNSLNTTGVLPAGNISGVVISSIILNPAACSSPTVNTNPADQSVCTSGTTTFTASFTGGAPAPTLLWQVQTGGVGLFTDLTETAPYSGTATNTLTITNPNISLSTNRYRLKANNTCGDVFSNSALLTVNTNVTAGTISGTTALCAPGQTAQFTTNGNVGGIWSSTNTAVATVNATGLVTIAPTPASPFYTDITYTINTGCGSPVSSFRRVYAYNLQSASAVYGPATLCVGATAIFSEEPQDGSPGGEWNSTNTSVATVGKYTGLVTAVGAGSTNITYTVYGCLFPGFATAGKTLVVDPTPNAGTVTGVASLCAGSLFTFSSNGDAGGSWSSTNTAVATVNASSGIVTALSAGSTDIKYSVTGCSSSAETFNTLTVTGSATLAGTAGGPQICSNAAVQSSASQPSGTSFSDGSCNTIATILPSGLVPVTGNINTCVRVEDVVHTYHNIPYVQRVFDIMPATNGANATATITLYYTQGEFDAFNLARGIYPALPTGSGDAVGKGNLLITQFHGTGTYPGNYNGGVVDLINPDDSKIVWSGAPLNRWEITFDVNGFSGFYLHTSLTNTPLPINLVSFSGRNNGNVNLLEWATSSEQNSNYFELQRSVDGINFVKATSVPAAGNSNTTKNYNYSDNISGINSNVFYYRLKQVDISGLIRYSTIVKIKLNVKGFNVDASPNPFVDHIRVQVDAVQKENAVITLNTLDGKRILQQTTALNKGSNAIAIDGLDKLAGGIYLLTVVTDSQKTTIKVVKQ